MEIAYIILCILCIISIIGIHATVLSSCGGGPNFYNCGSVYPQLLLLDMGTVRAELESSRQEWEEWPEQYLLGGSNHNWEVLPLFAFGKWSKHTGEFPRTVNILKSLGTGVVSAGFSKLGPGTKLKPHQGWAKLSNRVLRCHYGLEVPKQGTLVHCGGETRRQYQDRWLVFDDSREHSAENTSTTVRTIFLIDMVRPWYVKKGRSRVEYSQELDNFIRQM